MSRSNALATPCSSFQRRPAIPLELSAIWDDFPAEWRRFVPNPSQGYVQPVREDLTRMGVIPAGDRAFSGFSGVPRYFHPRAGDEEMLLDLELICWFFYFDDPFDDGEIDSAGASGLSLVERMEGVLETGELPTDPRPVERLCRQFRSRARRMAGGHLAPWRRFIARCREWVRSISPINRRSHRSQPDLAEYARLRLPNVGTPVEVPLNEIIGGYVLDDGFVEMPEVRRFGDLASLVIAYCNDIYSYERETERRTQLNSLEIRRTQLDLELPEAFSEQLADIRAMIREMEEIEQRLRRSGMVGLSAVHDGCAGARRRRDQTRYLEDIEAMVVGNHLWSLNDGRYHSRTSPFLELRLPPKPRRPVTNFRSVREAPPGRHTSGSPPSPCRW